MIPVDVCDDAEASLLTAVSFCTFSRKSDFTKSINEKGVFLLKIPGFDPTASSGRMRRVADRGQGERTIQAASDCAPLPQGVRR